MLPGRTRCVKHSELNNTKQFPSSVCFPVVGIVSENKHKLHAYSIGRSLVRSQLVSLEFFIDIKSFRSHYGPGVDSASNRNEYQEHFLRGKCGRCVRLTTFSLTCAAVMKSGNLNILEPTGRLQACNGTAFTCVFSGILIMLIKMISFLSCIKVIASSCLPKYFLQHVSTCQVRGFESGCTNTEGIESTACRQFNCRLTKLGVCNTEIGRLELN